MNIRIPTVSDAEDITAYVRRLYAEDLPTLIPPARQPAVDETRKFIRSHSGDGASVIFIAIDEKGVAGMVHFSQNTRPRLKHSVFVGLNVRKDRRHKGIGRKLMGKALSWSKKRKGIKRIQLGVLANNKPAIRLYRSLGFKVEGRQRAAVKRGNKYTDIVLMVKFCGLIPR